MTSDTKALIERLRRFAERVYAQKVELWPTPERPYVVKHDRANCDDPEHLGCAHVGLVEAARAAALALESLTAHPAPSGWQQRIAAIWMVCEKLTRSPVGVYATEEAAHAACKGWQFVDKWELQGQNAVDALPPEPAVVECAHYRVYDFTIETHICVRCNSRVENRAARIAKGLPKPDAKDAIPPQPTTNEVGDVVCEHGTAMDVHCCNCHSGFLFDSNACVCGQREVLVRLMDADDDPLLVHDAYPECGIGTPHRGSMCPVWNPKVDPLRAAVDAELAPLAEQLTEVGHRLAKGTNDE